MYSRLETSRIRIPGRLSPKPASCLSKVNRLRCCLRKHAQAAASCHLGPGHVSPACVTWRCGRTHFQNIDRSKLCIADVSWQHAGMLVLSRDAAMDAVEELRWCLAHRSTCCSESSGYTFRSWKTHRSAATENGEAFQIPQGEPFHDTYH
jgi:hypothetical protein